MPKILKRSLALFLALMMCFSLVPASAFAVEDEAAVNQAEETVLPEENQPEELPDAAEQLPAPEESPAPEEGGEEAEKAPEQEEAPVTEETPEEPEAPAPAFETVKVCFVCEAPVDLSGLTVYGSGGAVLEPYYDGDSSETSFGVYYLAPGEYTYSFHDESGVYADAENIAFTVSSAEAEQTVEIVLTEAEEEPLPGVEVHSFTYINPLYEDVVDESDIPEVEFTQEDYDEFTALIEGEAKSPKASAANGMHLFAAFNAGAGEIIHTSVADAAAELRPYLAAREPSITIAISSPEEVDYRAFAKEIFSGAAIHTGNPTEGDYLSFQYGGYRLHASISQKGSDYIYRFTYGPLYYTTAAQEGQMTMKVNSVLSGLNLSGKTEYQKIKAIYGYLCDNVRYDYANLRNKDYRLKYTGYAALVNGTAVCQGYSVAFYRLCLEAGIDARIISSVKMNHAWNIAKYVNNYYELDSTWDEGKTFDNYLYFLRGSTYWISSHKYKGVSTIGDEFSNSAFKAAYNLSSSDAPKYYTVSYNANGGTGAPGPQDKQKGKSIRLSTIAPTHPRTEFLGWATTDDATDAEYQPGDTFRTDADTTLYAVWKISYIVPDGICGNELSWTLDTAGRLTVYGSGAMPDYASSADTPWHDYSDLIKSVIIDDGVTKIGKYAFRGCGSLTRVIIPATVTSIGTGAFRACGALASISVVSSNTAYSSAGNCLIEIASGKLIRGCNNSVIPAEGVTSIGDFSFDGCTGLKSITIPSTVTAIGTNAFYNCSSLTSISIPAGVKSIGTYAFLGCTALTSITVESGNTAYSGAGNCLIGKDSHILISGCNNSVIPAEGITSISDYAFYGCRGLAGATIPEGVTSIGIHAFRGCSSLASITLPESLTSIGEKAFYGCTKLASVCFNGTASQEDALRSGTSTGNNTLLNIKWVILKDKGPCGGNVSWKLDANGVLTISGSEPMADYGYAETPWYSYGGLIKSVVIKNGVTSIGEGAFWDCAGFTSITIPDSVETIGNNAFNGCTGLTSITIPDSVKTIGDYAFFGCDNLADVFYKGTSDEWNSITIGSDNHCLTRAKKHYSLADFGECGENLSWVLDTNGVLTIFGSGAMTDYGFWATPWYSHIDSIKSVIIENGVTSIGTRAFYGCTGLTSITIPDSVTSIGEYAFAYSGLASITIPASVKTIGSNAFSDCTKLTSITIPDSVETIGSYTFIGCIGLTSITIPDSVTSIGKYAFAYSGLASITIPAGVTSIGEGAFKSCEVLTSITIPGSVTSVGSAAFNGCTGLENVYYDGSPLDWKKISIGSSNGRLTGANITYSIPFAKTVTISHDSQDITGKTVDADIYRDQTYQLTATAAPYNAKQQFTWTSSSTAVATVDTNGLVTFRKPGTVTITAAATDGSGKNAKVTFNVFYYDAAAKFTASTDAPSTGLEVNYSAQISVFGKDKTAALNPSMFEYTLSNVKNGPFIEVSDAGEITVIKPGGTTTVTAALINDPLGRTVTVSVKTVPTRTKELHIKPLDTEVIRTDDDYEDGFYAIDCNGEITSDPDRFVSYALFLNKLPKGSQKAFPLVLDATDFSDRPIPLPNTEYTWTSSNTKIATVAKDGTVTIKANVDGACTITATSKDGNKAQGTIAIYVMDKTPRLDAAKVTLDVQKTNEVTVGLVSSYGNDVDSVIFKENKSDVPSTKVKVNYENELVTVTAPTFLNNQTIKGQLVVTTKGSPTPYELPFNVVIKNSAPSVTVKQPSKLNLFYTDIGNTPVDLNVSVKNEQITSIEFEAEDFTGIDNGNGTVTVKLKEHSSTPATKATLTIYLVGYTYPIEKTITVGTVTTKPKLTVTPASAVINTLLNENYSSEFAVYNNATGDYITVAEMGISAAAAEWASLTGEGTNAVLTLTGTTGGKAAISVRESNWASPITVYHTVSVKSDLPTAKLGTGTLTLNSEFLNSAETTLTLDQANVSITDIRTPDLTAVPKGVDKDVAEDWFKVAYADGRITAEFSDAGETAIGSGALKTGTYSFSITPYAGSVDLNPVTLKISVKNTIPTVTASAVTLNKRLNETGVSTLKLSAKGYTVTGIDGLNSSPNLGIEYADGVLKVWLTDTAKALPKAQTFNVTLTPTVEMDGYDTPAAAKPFTLKVSMIDKAPSASVSASGKIDVIVKRSGITYTLTKLNNAVGKVTGFELDGANADLFTLEELEPNSKGQPRYMLTLKDDAVCAANVTYKIKLRFTLDREDGDVIYTPVLNVKPIRSALKLTAAPAAQIFYQSQSRDRVVTYTVKLTSPAGVNIKSVNVGNVSFWQKALADNAENISINISGDTATVKVTLKDTSKLNSGKSYTLPLEISAEGYPGNISSAKLNLSLKVLK